MADPGFSQGGSRNCYISKLVISGILRVISSTLFGMFEITQTRTRLIKVSDVCAPRKIFPYMSQRGSTSLFTARSFVRSSKSFSKTSLH